MLTVTHQTKEWEGRFGKKYTNRNAYSLKRLDDLYRKNCGIARSEFNRLFLGRLSRDIKILEIGSNVGNQLLLLQKMGFKNLCGIEINRYAIEFSKKRTSGIDIIRGSAFDIPFKNGYFDLVFTSGVLIHIHPGHINDVLREIHRCAKRYIWGYEFYADKYSEKVYRGHRSLFWRANFAKLYLSLFDDLVLVKQKLTKYFKGDNIDAMFLLKKVGR
ncbi:MAG: methyltransferase domain-containing protein [Candidatus Omnitrophica bacterium]|nr:methyltransferase domain-containing protein [Candidatus Omnitrophota bacterium]